MNEAITTPDSPTRRARFRYSVRSILFLTTLVACALGPVMYERHRCEQQALIRNRIPTIDTSFFGIQEDFEVEPKIPIRTGLWQSILGNNEGDQVTSISMLGFEGEIPNKLMRALTYFPNVKFLSIHDETVEANGFSHLAKLCGLEKLVLARTDITDAELSSIRGLTKLTYLDLRNTQIGSEGAAHLANLTNLKTLHLQQTQMGDDGVQYLTKLKNLEHLDLSDTNVSEKAIDVLAQFTKLTLLALNPDTFSVEARDKLRKRLPKCDVIFARN